MTDISLSLPDAHHVISDRSATPTARKSRAATPRFNEDQSSKQTKAQTIHYFVPHSTIPRLDDLVMKVIVDRLIDYPIFDYLPAHYQKSMAVLINESINQSTPPDLIVALSYIQSEIFWHEMCMKRWCQPSDDPSLSGWFNRSLTLSNKPSNQSSIDLSLHGHSWRQAYCEKYVSERLEKWNNGDPSNMAPDANDQSINQVDYPTKEREFIRELIACAPYIQSITLSNYPCHSRLDVFLSRLTRLNNLSIKFGCRRLKLDYDVSLFGMKLIDGLSLSNLCSNHQSINQLVLSENLIDCALMEVLILGLVDCPSLTSLNLSHNKIGEQGGQLIAQLINQSNNQLIYIDLSDNLIGPQGAASIANAIKQSNKQSTNSLSINLSLNPLTPVGVDHLLQSIKLSNNRIDCLTLNHVGANPSNLPTLIDSLINHSSSQSSNQLQELYFASNQLCDPSINQSNNQSIYLESLLVALQSNNQLSVCDLSQCGFDDDQATYQSIKRLLRDRQEAHQAVKRTTMEKQWKQAM